MFSDEDTIRSTYYRSNIERAGFQSQFSDLADYLRSLEMGMIVGPFDEFHLPRIAQLINKSNQFHLTTTRYTESEISAIGQDKRRTGLYFKLKDRFGDNGLISAVILQQQPDASMVIDTWVMSCRVLSRGVEEFICSEIISLARQQKMPEGHREIYPHRKEQACRRSLWAPAFSVRSMRPKELLFGSWL